MFKKLRQAWITTLNKATYEKLDSLVQDRDLIDQITNNGDYNNVNTEVREFGGEDCFVSFLDQTPLFYLVPTKFPKDYKIYYRVGYADIYTSTLLALDLNLNASAGSIVTMPESMDLTQPQGIYYCTPVNRSNLSDKNNILKFLLPIQREVAFKLNLVISRLTKQLGNMDSVNREFYLDEEEDEDEEEDGGFNRN